MNSHNVNTVPLSVADSSAATQKLPAVKTAKASEAGGASEVPEGPSTHGKDAASVKNASSGSADNSSSSGGLTGSRPDNVAGNSVASRRAAHGLSPETAADVAEVKRMEKEASAKDRKLKAQHQHKAKVVRRSIVVIVLVLIIGIVFGFWLLRWGLHDDAASIQGTWRVQGTDTTITINDEEIVLTDEVAYDYAIDPESKTLTFKFGALTGDGRYRFSLDHNMLAIDDGEFDAMGTLVTDIPWMLEALSQKIVGNQEKSPSLEDGNMLLERVS